MPIAAVPLQQIAQEAYDSDSGDVVKCKARNKKCTSLVLEEIEKYSPAMHCDIFDVTVTFYLQEYHTNGSNCNCDVKVVNRALFLTLGSTLRSQ